MHNFSDDYCRVWVGNLSDRITDDLLYELFLQAGPVEDVVLPKTPDGRPRSFAFVTFKHRCSVLYSKELFKGTALFGKEIIIQPKVTEMSDNNYEGSVSLNSFSGFSDGMPKVPEVPDKNNKGLISLNSLRGFTGGTAMKGRDDLSKPYNKAKDYFNSSYKDVDLLPQRNSGALQNESLPDFDMLLKMAQQLQNPSLMNSGFGSPAIFPSQSKDSVMNKSRENSRGNYSQGENYNHSHGRSRDFDSGRTGHEKSHPYRDNRRDDRRHGYFSSRNHSSSSHHRDRK